MTPIRTDLDTQGLAEANQANMVAFTESMIAAGAVFPVGAPGLRGCWSLVPHPMLNCLFRTRLDPATVDAAIAQTDEFYQERERPAIWMVWPNDGPADLTDRLLLGGWRFHHRSPCMAIDMHQLEAGAAVPLGLTITPVRTPEELELFFSIVQAVFHLSDGLVAAFTQAFRHIGLGPDSPQQSYIGWLDGRPVATTTLVLAAGVAGIYNVATQVEHRRRGLGRAMTLHALADGRQRGYRYGILQSSEMGASLYAGMGFIQVGQRRGFVR